jgi:hypothetical protein
MIYPTKRALQSANPNLNILSVDAPIFGQYGRLLTQVDPSEVIANAKALVPDTDKVVYEASVPALEKPFAFNEQIAREVYGGMPVQVGWCYGKNLQMAALEYHKGSEVVVCLTDTVLLLGLIQDVVFGEQITYKTSGVAAFYAPEGAVVELPAWSLHYAPIHTTKGGSFATLVYLPKGTNEPLPYTVEKAGESRLLFAVNKWLIAHPDSADAANGAYPGLVGEDIFINPA